MKKFIILCVISFSFFLSSNGQLRHYISYTTIPYSNFFNKEKDAISNIDLKHAIGYPNLSYTVFYKKLGLECYFNNPDKGYFELLAIPDTSITSIKSFNLGLNVHYQLLQKRKIRLSILSGICFNRTFSQIFYEENKLSPWTGNGYLELIVGGKLENKIGFNLGVQMQIPIYENFYLSTGSKYYFYPFSTFRPVPEITINKQNFIWDIGIGYSFITKKKKK